MKTSRVGGEELTPEHFFRQADPSGLGSGHTTSGLNCLEGAAIDAGIGRLVGVRLDVDEIAPTACPMVVADMATVFSSGETNADVIPCSGSWLLCVESRSVARPIPTKGIIEVDSLAVTETGSWLQWQCTIAMEYRPRGWRRTV